MPDATTIASFSATGRRDTNEDRFVSAQTSDGALRAFAVADGLGGHDAGEIASARAVEAIAAELARTESTSDLHDTAARLFDAAHAAVEAERERRAPSDMATTLALVLARGDTVMWGHVGDSRVYRMRHGRVERLTRDHTAAESMRTLSRKRSDPVANDHTNHLLATIGSGTRFCEIGAPEALLDGDVFLLCTDGAWVHVSERDLVADAGATSGPEAWLERLRTRIVAADDRDQDNYTALAFCAGTWNAAAAEAKQPSLLRRLFAR